MKTSVPSKKPLKLPWYDLGYNVHVGYNATSAQLNESFIFVYFYYISVLLEEPLI